MPAAAPGPAGGPSDRTEQIALFRYRVVAEAANPRLTPAERGRLVRALARQAHEHPDGTLRTFSRGTLDRWIATYQARGLDGLPPQRRADAGAVRRHPELLAEAAALRAGRYQASRPGERWIGDVPVGGFVPYPRVAGSKRARLFVLVDDHSRLLSARVPVRFGRR